MDAATAGQPARELYWRGQEHPSGETRPIADPRQQQALHQTSLGGEAHVLFGTITGGTPLAQCYRVQPERGHPPVVAVLGTTTSVSAIGVRQLNTLLPGTGVWVLLHPRNYFGVILAVEPAANFDPRRGLADQISQASRARSDALHKRPLRMTANGGIVDWSGNRPFDSLFGGEWGGISETGIRIFLDSFMFQAAVDETCGIWGFYHDQLLRIAAYNLHFFTSGWERLAHDDQGEYNDVEGWTPYPWEHLGLFSPGTPFRTITAAAAQAQQNYYSTVEPQQDDQKPFHRVLDIRGYLGQGGRRIIAIPPQVTETVNRFGDNTPAPIGVFDQFQTLDGTHVTRSARGLAFIKRPAIVVPSRKRMAEDPTGDDPTNYRASGIGTEGQEHKIRTEPEQPDLAAMPTPGDTESLVRAAGLVDYMTQLCNWACQHPFDYHARDWKLGEEGAGDAQVVPQVVPDYSLLGDETYLPPPTPVTYRVDHRYGEADYYPNSAGWTVFPDGSVTIWCGWGATVQMTGGDITLAAPGDINVRAGRNFNVMSGHDTTIRAKNSFDVSATTNDVRIAANKNMQVVSGLGGQGGLLLESQANADTFDFENKVGEDVVSSGVMLRAVNAAVVGWSRDVYLRSGANGGGGTIILDAGQGEGTLITNTQDINHFVANGIFHWFGEGSSVEKVNEFTKNGAGLGANLYVNGVASLLGNVFVDGEVQVVNGHISTERATDSPFVGSLNDQGIDRIKNFLEDYRQRAAETLPNLGKEQFESRLEQQFYQENQAGHEKVINTASFSFRNAEQYKTERYVLYEALWQQMARLSGQSLTKWRELSVQAGSETTNPYPGQKWMQAACYRQMDLNLFDMQEGTSKPRSENREAYEQPKYATPQAMVPDGNYTVIM